MTSLFTTIFDSTPFRIFFAAWTGFYLWQVILGDEGTVELEFLWITMGFLAAMWYLGSKSDSTA